jgi:ubiquinone/menaquinone biosynthesis C-methylase UbiE
MNETDKAFVGSIPDIYDGIMVPLIFEPYARDLAGRLRGMASGRLLEIAAGTGAVTRELARALPDSVEIVATDLNEPMLERAKASLADRAITWRQADAGALPFGDAEFDAVVCQFGVMFFPDKTAAFREVRRTLKPGKRFLFSVWEGIEDNDFARTVVETLAVIFPADPPRFIARTPHGHYARPPLEQALREAGFETVAFEAIEDVSRAPSPREAAVGYCQGTPVRGEIEARDPSGLEEVTARVEEALALRYGSGPIEGRIQATLVTAS